MVHAYSSSAGLFCLSKRIGEDRIRKKLEEGEKVPRAVMMYPWQSFPYQPGPGSMSPVIPPLPVMPTSLSKHPQLWTKEEVAVWLKWCVEEYSIAHISAEKFNMNGKALCLLVRSDFMERVPDVGDILYNVLQKLISRNSGPVLYQPLPTYPTITTGNSVYATPSSCSLSVPRRDNTYLVVPGNTTRTNISQTRSNYIPILPDLKKSIQSRDNGPKYPIPITPYRMQAPHPPDNVLSPAPSGGSDSSQSDRHSDSPSPSSNDICHNGFAELRPFPDGSLETENPAPHGLTGYDRPLTKPSSPVWREKNTDSKTSERGCDMAFGELGKLGFNSNFAYRQARTGDCRLLWEFINYLLVNGTYTDYIRWEDRDKLTFRIINPTALAELWGIQKNRTNMTYEKLSRALRYYYKMNIIKKVTGKRLTYQFLRQPKDIKKGQRGARPQQRPAMSQYPFPAGLSGLHGSDDHSVKQDSHYIADTVYRASGDHTAAEERLRNGEHPLPSEPSRTSELFPSEDRPRGEQRCDCESSPSPPIPPPPQQSPVGSISYSGTAEMVTFPVQDEPEDLSLKAGSPDRPSIKQEPMETKHDVNSNLTNKECHDVLSTPGSVKLEPDAGQMETNS